MRKSKVSKAAEIAAGEAKNKKLVDEFNEKNKAAYEAAVIAYEGLELKSRYDTEDKALSYMSQTLSRICPIIQITLTLKGGAQSMCIDPVKPFVAKQVDQCWNENAYKYPSREYLDGLIAGLSHAGEEISKLKLQLERVKELDQHPMTCGTSPFFFMRPFR